MFFGDLMNFSSVFRERRFNGELRRFGREKYFPDHWILD